MKKLRVGVVGCRPIGYQHADAIADIEYAELVAGCDLSTVQLEEFTDKYEARWPNLQTYSDLGEMLTTADLDVVTVATGDNAHANLVVDSAHSGIKGIFCEKPLATNLADADRMIDACAANGTILSIDHTRRWTPIWTHAWQLIHEEKAIGPVQYIISHLTGPRAMLFRNGTHMLDIICYYANSSPEWVMAELEEGFEDYSEYRGDGGHDPDSEPAASGYIHFANGVRGFFPCGSKKAENLLYGRVDVFGSDGSITIDDTLTLSRGGEVEQLTPPRQAAHGIAAGTQELVRLVAEGGTPVSPGTDGIKSLEIIIGFLESQRRGSAPVTIASLRS